MSDWQIVHNEKRSRVPSARLYVSLNKRGEIVINPAAWRWMGDIYNVTLLYDAERRLIGVKSPVALDRHFFPVGRCGRGTRQHIIHARRLIKQFEINVNETLIFQNIEMTYYNGERILILDLKSAQIIANRRQRNGVTAK